MTDRLIELDPNEFSYGWEDANELDLAYPGDETHCATGPNICPGRKSYGDRVYAAIVGTYLREDADGYEHPAWATCYYWESTGPVLDGKPTAICEDCWALYSFDSYDYYTKRGDTKNANRFDPVSVPMFEGEICGVVWDIAINSRNTFFAHLATYGPDGGAMWEQELGEYGTVLAALAAAGAWGREWEAEVDRREEGA